jgi:hypothetical protein
VTPEFPLELAIGETVEPDGPLERVAVGPDFSPETGQTVV